MRWLPSRARTHARMRTCTHKSIQQAQHVIYFCHPILIPFSHSCTDHKLGDLWLLTRTHAQINTNTTSQFVIHFYIQFSFSHSCTDVLAGRPCTAHRQAQWAPTCCSICTRCWCESTACSRLTCALTASRWSRKFYWRWARRAWCVWCVWCVVYVWLVLCICTRCWCESIACSRRTCALTTSRWCHKFSLRCDYVYRLRIRCIWCEWCVLSCPSSLLAANLFYMFSQNSTWNWFKTIRSSTPCCMVSLRVSSGFYNSKFKYPLKKRKKDFRVHQ